QSSGRITQQRTQPYPTPGGPTVDNENETLVALLVIALIVFGIFRIVGDFQNLYEQTEQKGQELSRWSKS
ncbi:hypothetical protein ACM799_28850, partial [Pseudomonas aeruginosa]